MGRIIKLNIISPGRETITEDIVCLSTTESDGKIEFLANYAPSIVSTIPTVSTFTKEDGEKKKIFTSSGIVYVENNVINFCCDSVSWPEEIDKNRAEAAKERALKRLEAKKDINIKRAKRALERANARLELIK